MKYPKFGTLGENHNPIAYDYGNKYYRQPCGDTARLLIGPTDSQIKLLDELAKSFPTHRYFILYVLLENRPGRYESPLLENHEDLQLFIWTFQTFLEGDGRHHLWITSPDSANWLIYDQHNVIFAYGDLDAFESILNHRGYQQEEFWFPSPHTHFYPPTNDKFEDELLSYFEWSYSELQPCDTWD